MARLLESARSAQSRARYPHATSRYKKMPFAQIDCSPSLLAELNLPLQFDARHRYHYRIYRHSSDMVFYVIQSYSHGPETFTKKCLLVGGAWIEVKDEFQVKAQPPYWKYKLQALRMIVEGPLSSGLLSTLQGYLRDVIRTYEPGPYLEISDDLEMQVVQRAPR